MKGGAFPSDIREYPGASLRAQSRFKSPATCSLIILLILLGKAVTCAHHPGRALLFDAMLMVPISLMAYHRGLFAGMAAAAAAVGGGLLVSFLTAQVMLAQHLPLGGGLSVLLARLLSFQVLAAIVATLSRHARREMLESRQKVLRYRRAINGLQARNRAIEQEARDREAEFERSLLKYSALVHMLEESARKIYSNLETDRLFNSLFRVLEECFGATCSSVYLKSDRERAFLLANTCGVERCGCQLPLRLEPGDERIAELIDAHQPAWWSSDQRPDSALDAVLSGVLLDKTEVVGIVNVHTIDRAGTPDVMLMGMVCNIASIAFTNARLFSKVQWLAERDPLTGLYNRRMFHDAITEQVGGRTPGAAPFGLIMLDMDHFKAFNDTYGHQAGDAVLEWFAANCARWAGEENEVYRYGGEEFAIIMPESDAETAADMAETIRRRVNESTIHYNGHEMKVMISFGVAAFPENGVNDDELVRKADRALYRAKAAGRNRVVVSDADAGQKSPVVTYPLRVDRSS